MNKLKYIVLPLLVLSISSCGKNTDTSSESNISPSGDTSSSITSESEDSQTGSEYIYESNPMNEPLIYRQHYLNHIGDIFSTWKKYRGKGVTIAVIDEGFESEHEDFTFADGTSKVSDKSAYFYVSGNTVKKEVGIKKVKAGEASHGTFCAGVAAAGLNGKGVIGIAPEANLLLLKTDLKPKSIVEAFKYAADNGAKVITISIGSYADGTGDLKDKTDLTTIFNEPVKYCTDKGIVVCSAAGNGGPTESNRPTEFTYPGGAVGVIGVGGLAANSSDTIWSGSSYNQSKNKQFCDVFAPSEGMYGCANYGNVKYDGGYKDDEHKYKWNGTSFASPIVAGMAALYFEKYPDRGVTEFERDLYDSCQNMVTTGLPLGATGNGRVDVGKLLDTECDEEITINVTYSGSTLYAFSWNNEGTEALDDKEWPGKKLTKKNNVFSVTIDASKYQNVIFNTGGDAFKTYNLLTSSFLYNNKYNLNGVVTENLLKLGKYVKN